MKFLMVAFGITLGTSLAIYSGLRLFAGLEGEAVFSIAAFPFLASGHIYEVLERRAAAEELKSVPHQNLLTFPDFGLPWYKLLILSILLFMGSVQAFSAYTGVVTTIMETPLKLSMFGLLELPVNATMAFLIGRWLGARCHNLAVAMCMLTLAIAACVLADRLVAFRMYSDTSGQEDPVAVFGAPGSAQFFESLSIGVALYSVIGWAGLWRGSRLREERYTSYLLRIMPRSSRLTLISLARDEVAATIRAHNVAKAAE